ncbi:caspase family protein [Actinoplanes awajinensis]|uniref:Caspase family p20 domain-containing protein n=1 Tax=Actinoplanes awajinensis subsp. mycoplanecinus TaxID=135947 RepID=A0A101JN63_9ACTN|nr:caspase family protein [Actinoplanes awajinensis]KUL29436.1 hypothetical protein ADL15_27860 [Actinoplanes awajinensis subsp. mycoplanecinus]
MTNPLHFALIVGINRYPGLNNRDITSPSSNAAAFQEWLCQESGGGLPPGNVHTVQVSTPADDSGDPARALPNQAAIDTGLELLQQRAEKATRGNETRWATTRLYLFWTGHGILPSHPGTGDRPLAALLTADTREITPGAHVDMGGYLGYLTQRAAFREVVAFADCCRKLLDVAPRGPSLRPPAGPRRTVVTLAGYAADADDPAFARIYDTDEHQARGVFTAALLDVLSDWAGIRAAAPGVNAVNLFNDQMPRRMADQLHQRRQDPVFYSNNVADVTFGSGHEPPVCTVRLRLPPDAQDVVLVDSGYSPLAEWRHAPATVDLKLRRGLYQLTVGGSGHGLRNDGLFAVSGGECVVAF